MSWGVCIGIGWQRGFGSATGFSHKEFADGWTSGRGFNHRKGRGWGRGHAYGEGTSKGHGHGHGGNVFKDFFRNGHGQGYGTARGSFRKDDWSRR